MDVYEVPATISLSVFAFRSVALCLNNPIAKIKVNFSKKGIRLSSNMQREEELLKALKYLVRIFSRIIGKNFGVEVDVTNTIPENFGLGETSSILAAVCQAICRRFNLDLDTLRKIELCLKAESVIKEHNPENFAAIFNGGLVLMRHNPLFLRKISIYEFDCILVIPGVRYGARKLFRFMPRSLRIFDASDQCINVTLLALGLERGDLDLIKEISLNNAMEIPIGKFIPYFLELKQELSEMGCPVILCKLGPSFIVLGKGKMDDLADFIEDFYEDRGCIATCIPTKLSNFGIRSLSTS